MGWRIVWPRFLAFLNLCAALVFFVVDMCASRCPWPGNAGLLVWLVCALAVFVYVNDKEEEGQL